MNMSNAESFVLRHSRGLILTHQHRGGAYPASEAFSAYQGYCWFRDGSFIADAMSACGEVASASAFFDWCAGVIERESDAIARVVDAQAAGTPLPDGEMLPTRFTLDGQRGTDEEQWWDFQLDGYGTWLWAVWQHAQRHGLDIHRWAGAIEKTAEYLVSSWERPCYDWWEEHSEAVHISTLGCVAAGLQAAHSSGVLSAGSSENAQVAAQRILQRIKSDGVIDGHLCKWIGNPKVDGSLAALIAPLGVIPPQSELARSTLDAIERDLERDGGVYRFQDDVFFGGGRWPLLTAFLGLGRSAQGQRGAAEKYLQWVLACADRDGNLPEQDSQLLLHPEHFEDWVSRWGQVAQPLLWSHAMALRLASELADGKGELR